MDTSALVLGLRVVLALAVVLGLLWWLSRRTAGGRRVPATAVHVVGRQSLGRHAGVAVVEVEGRRLLLGVTDSGVRLLTELEGAPAPDGERSEIDPAELERMVGLDADAEAPAPAAAPARRTAPRPARTTPAAARRQAPTDSAARTLAVPTPRNPLEGSLLDAGTWRQAVVAVQERTIRR